MNDEKEIELKMNTTIEIVGFNVSSTHPIVRDMYEKDKEYINSLGLDGWKIAKEKGKYNVIFDNPIIVSTGQ